MRPVAGSLRDRPNRRADTRNRSRQQPASGSQVAAEEGNWSEEGAYIETAGRVIVGKRKRPSCCQLNFIKRKRFFGISVSGHAMDHFCSQMRGGQDGINIGT